MKIWNITRLVCLNVLVIDSLRNLPIIAKLGSNLFMLYIFAAVIFLIPVAYVSRRIAEVALTEGAASITSFTKMELGNNMAKLQQFFLWSYNVLWYPTLIIFLASFIAPILQHNINITHIALWLILPLLFLSLLPVALSTTISTLLAIFGAVIPMSILAIYAVVTLFTHPDNHVMHYFIPHFTEIHLDYIPTVFFSLMGIEIATMHSDILFSKKSEWNTAIWISVVLIIFLLTGCGLAVWELGGGYFLEALTVSLTKIFAFVPIPHFTTMVIVFIALSVLAQAVFWMQATARGIVKAFYGHVKGVAVRSTIILQVTITIIAIIGIMGSDRFHDSFLYIANISVLLAVIYHIILTMSYLRFCYKNGKNKIWSIIGLSGMLILLVITIATL